MTQEVNDALVIAATSGKGFLQGMVLGSTVNHLLRHTKLPLLVMRYEGDTDIHNKVTPILPCKPSNQSLLFPTDFSEHAQHAFEFLIANAAQHAKHITLLHVQDQLVMKYRTASEIEKFNLIDRDRLEEMKRKVEAISNADVQTHVMTGNPTMII